MTIDLEAAADIDHLHEIFKERLGFPNFYGKNWDAFWDTITALVVMPEELRLINWEGFERKYKKDSIILNKIIIDFNEEFKTMKIITTDSNIIK